MAREPAFRALLDFGQGTSVSYLFKKKKKIISQVHAIGCQWFSSAPLDNYFYSEQIASSRTFCVYEQVCLKSPIIVLFSLPRCCHTLIISFDMIDFYNQLKICDIKATLFFLSIKIIIEGMVVLFDTKLCSRWLEAL